MNLGIGTKPFGRGFIDYRGRNGGRIIVKEVKNDVIEIYGKSSKNLKSSVNKSFTFFLPAISISMKLI